MFLTGAWLLWSATATAQDWPQWRGPKRDGTAAFLSNEAELVVAAASGQEFSELARYRLAESPTWAHPVPVGDKLLVKDLNSLALWSFSK